MLKLTLTLGQMDKMIEVALVTHSLLIVLCLDIMTIGPGFGVELPWDVNRSDSDIVQEKDRDNMGAVAVQPELLVGKVAVVNGCLIPVVGAGPR
jgi:hypothetical protein